MERLESEDLFSTDVIDEQGNHYCGAYDNEGTVVHIIGSSYQTALCQMEFPNLEETYGYKYLIALTDEELTKKFRPIKNKVLSEIVRELTLEINKT